MSYDQIQDLIDMGNGFAAAELGQPYDVYRMVQSDDAGNVLIPINRIASSVKFFTKIAYGGGVRESLETEKNQGVLWYRLIGDLRPFLVGDIFILNDPVYGRGSSSVNFFTKEYKGFALADHSPIKKSLGGRLNCTVNVLRPSAVPNASGQWDKTRQDAQPVVLSDSVFSLGDVGETPCQLPAGLIAMGRSYGERGFTQVPGEQRKSSWELYMPALNGFNIREGDRIIGPDGARYIVVIPYSQHVGATGSQWFMEREAAG